MRLGSAVRGAVLSGLLCGVFPGLGAEAPAAPAPDRSFHLVQRLAGPRVIKWFAFAHQPGQFAIWRVDRRVERVGTVPAEAGQHAYRFVDAAVPTGAFVVYRLTYEGPSGSSQVLVVATVAEPGLRDAASRGGVSPNPDALPARGSLLLPPNAPAEVVHAASQVRRRLQPPPDPPPPRA